MHGVLSQDKIKLLYDLGHFFNPKFPDGLNIRVEDLSKLKWTDKVLQDALESFVDIMTGNLKSGESTDVFEMTRCGHPDYTDPRLNKDIGSGSWPEPCQKAGIKIHINKSNMPSALTSRWPDIQKDVFAAYHKIGANLVETTNINEANVTVMWQVLAGSTIGLAEFNSQSCSDRVFCKLDPGYTGLMFELFAHELGHNMNLQHTRGGIMNPSVIEVNPKAWNTNDPSYNTLVRFFGGKPINPPNPGPEVLPTGKLTFDVSGSKMEVDFSKQDLKFIFNSGKVRNFVLLSNDII